MALYQDIIVWQAKERTEQLERSVQHAQARESRVVEMSQWMSEVSGLLQSRLDADILAGDVPKEYEVYTWHIISLLHVILFIPYLNYVVC